MPKIKNFQIYYSEQVIKVPVAAVKGKCEVRKKEDLNPIPTTYVFEHFFFCEQLYDPLSLVLQKVTFPFFCHVQIDCISNIYKVIY